MVSVYQEALYLCEIRLVANFLKFFDRFIIKAEFILKTGIEVAAQPSVVIICLGLYEIFREFR